MAGQGNLAVVWGTGWGKEELAMKGGISQLRKKKAGEGHLAVGRGPAGGSRHRVEKGPVLGKITWLGSLSVESQVGKQDLAGRGGVDGVEDLAVEVGLVVKGPESGRVLDEEGESLGLRTA